MAWANSWNSIPFEEFTHPFNLATGITKADEGKAVSIDTSGAEKVKLAADGDFIIGYLQVVENRTNEGTNIGTVALRFREKLPVKSGATFAIGDTAVGAGAGEVKPRRNAGDSANESDYRANVVLKVETGFVYVLKA